MKNIDELIIEQVNNELKYHKKRDLIIIAPIKLKDKIKPKYKGISVTFYNIPINYIYIMNKNNIKEVINEEI